jgi:hypothetical protein
MVCMITYVLIGESGRAPWPQHIGEALLDRMFEVLWVEVAAVQDDEVLETAGDVQLALPQEALRGGEKRREG